MTTSELIRLIGYAAAVALGLLFGALGAIRGDAELIGSGLALIGVGSTAGGALGRQVSRGRHAA